MSERSLESSTNVKLVVVVVFVFLFVCVINTSFPE